MPKNEISDLITDQEMAFAHLVLSGTMNDRDAAQAAGLNPDTAASTKSQPRVRAYILEHRAVGRRQLAAQEDEGQRRLNLDRERVLARLWEISDSSAEITRGSFTSQVRALSMIVAMQGLIPGRASSPQPTPGSGKPPSPELAQEEDKPRHAEPEPVPASAADVPPLPVITPTMTFDPISFAVAPRVNPWETGPSARYAPLLGFALDKEFPLSIKKNLFAGLR